MSAAHRGKGGDAVTSTRAPPLLPGMLGDAQPLGMVQDRRCGSAAAVGRLCNAARA